MQTTKQQLKDIASKLMESIIKAEAMVEVRFRKDSLSVTFYIQDYRNFTIDLYEFYTYDKNTALGKECLEYIKTNCFAMPLRMRSLYRCNSVV
jgi:hypothetical protein